MPDDARSLDFHVNILRKLVVYATCVPISWLVAMNYMGHYRDGSKPVAPVHHGAKDLGLDPLPFHATPLPHLATGAMKRNVGSKDARIARGFGSIGSIPGGLTMSTGDEMNELVSGGCVQVCFPAAGSVY